MTLQDLINQIHDLDDPIISLDTPINFIDINCEHGGPDLELNIYRDEADQLIIRHL